MEAPQKVTVLPVDFEESTYHRLVFPTTNAATEYYVNQQDLESLVDENSDPLDQILAEEELDFNAA